MHEAEISDKALAHLWSNVCEQDEGGGWLEPCTICGRRYYHEHIRNVRSGNPAALADADDY